MDSESDNLNLQRWPKNCCLCVPTRVGIRLLGLIEFGYIVIQLAAVWELDTQKEAGVEEMFALLSLALCAVPQMMCWTIMIVQEKVYRKIFKSFNGSNLKSLLT